jgi:hypothetical protein
MQMTADTSDTVLATYREIAVQFGLSGTHAARNKVKRMGWTAERTGPAGPFRIRVPRQAWDQAATLEDRGPERQRARRRGRESRKSASRNIESLERAIQKLQEQLERAGDMPPPRVRALTKELDAARVQLTDLRLSAAIARTQATARQAAAERPSPGLIAFPGAAVFGWVRRLWLSVWRRSAAAELRTRLRA